MALVTAVRGKLNMEKLGLDRDGDVEFSPTNIRIAYNAKDYTDFGGSFTPGPGGTVTGTINSITNVENQKTTFTVSNVNADAETVFGFIANDDVLGAQSYILRNDDGVVGSDANDVLYGFAGADSIDGGEGKDKIVGGLGKDALTGGGKADLFIFTEVTDSGTASSARDTVFDFSLAEKDRIDLKAIDANANTLDVNDKFKLVDAFSGVAGELIIKGGSAGYVVQGDTNGDGAADFAILVKADAPLVANDLNF